MLSDYDYENIRTLIAINTSIKEIYQTIKELDLQGLEETKEYQSKILSLESSITLENLNDDINTIIDEVKNNYSEVLVKRRIFQKLSKILYSLGNVAVVTNASFQNISSNKISKVPIILFFKDGKLMQDGVYSADELKDLIEKQNVDAR